MRDELDDIGGAFRADIDIGSFLTFVDYFFDGIFVDWIVNGRINEARGNVQELQRRLEELAERLDAEAADAEGTLARAEARLERVVA